MHLFASCQAKLCTQFLCLISLRVRVMSQIVRLTSLRLAKREASGKQQQTTRRRALWLVQLNWRERSRVSLITSSPLTWVTCFVIHFFFFFSSFFLIVSYSFFFLFRDIDELTSGLLRPLPTPPRLLFHCFTLFRGRFSAYCEHRLHCTYLPYCTYSVSTGYTVHIYPTVLTVWAQVTLYIFTMLYLQCEHRLHCTYLPYCTYSVSTGYIVHIYHVVLTVWTHVTLYIFTMLYLQCEHMLHCTYLPCCTCSVRSHTTSCLPVWLTVAPPQRRDAVSLLRSSPLSPHCLLWEPRQALLPIRCAYSVCLFAWLFVCFK